MFRQIMLTIATAVLLAAVTASAQATPSKDVAVPERHETTAGVELPTDR